MHISEHITLKLIDKGSDTTRPSCELLFKGAPVHKTIQGAVLKSCVQFEGCYLLFVIDDVPYEEVLYLYLLDAQFNTLDSASLGAMYSSGHFTDLRLLSPDTVGFRFIGDTDWTVEVFKQARWRAPFIGDPKGVMHKPGFKRFFAVRGTPLPADT